MLTISTSTTHFCLIISTIAETLNNDKLLDIRPGVLSAPIRRHFYDRQFHPTYFLDDPSFNEAMMAELEGYTQCVHPGFLDTIFPDEGLPVDISSPRFLETLSKYDLWCPVEKCLKIPPKLDEENVEYWFNAIGYCMAEFSIADLDDTLSPTEPHLNYPSRTWSNIHANNPHCGFHNKRKNAILASSGKGPSPPIPNKGGNENDGLILTSDHWAAIRCICEVTDEITRTQRTREIMAAKTFILHATQPNIRFSVTLSIHYSSTQMVILSVNITDREGVISVDPIDLSVKSRWGPRALFRILAYMMFGKLEDIGYDSSIVVNEYTGEAKSIAFNNHEYTVDAIICNKQSVIGRATKVWRAQRSGVMYIIKDYWVSSSQSNREHEFLKKFKTYAQEKGIAQTQLCVPWLYDGGEVTLSNGMEDTTWYRQNYFFEESNRVHCRLILETVGVDLDEFSSARELFIVLKDAIRGHQFAYEKFGIIHRDISITNILICHDPRNGEPRGVLTDWDCAAYAVPQKCGAVDEIRGTLPFMSLEILRATGSVLHEPRHDLESFVYVLIYIFTVWAKPKQRANVPRSSMIQQWFKNDSRSLNDMFLMKHLHMLLPKCHIYPAISQFWSCFQGQLSILIRSVLDKPPFDPSMEINNNLSYELMFEVLDSCLELVSSNPELGGGSATNKKRKHAELEGSHVLSQSRFFDKSKGPPNLR